MTDLHDHLEQLARRGTSRGGDEVLAAARIAVDRDASVLRGVDDTANEALPKDVTVVGMGPDRRRARPRRLGAMVAAMGMAAMLFIGTLAFGAFLGSGGGSDSPEGAVRQLAAAVSQEDPIAAADVLVPEEVQSLNRTVDAASKRAQELALAKSAAAPLAGLDLSVDDLDLTTETLADGYVKVTVSGGSISARTESDKFSPAVQRALGDASNADSARADLATLAAGLDLPTFVVAVERGGHWYISAAYTTLEYIREANQLPPADFGSGVRATAALGADTPDAAVTEAMRALEHSDWATLMSLAPPDEIPVYDYRDALSQLGEDERTSFTIDQLETSSSISGDTAKVSLRAAGTTESGPWSLDGGCLKPPLDEGRRVAAGDWCDGNVFFSILPYYGSHPETAAAARLTAVREDGRWFVSPSGTVLDLVDQWIREVTQRQLFTMIGVPDQLPADGSIVLGEPVALGDSYGGAFVYTLDARRGDRLLGLVTATNPEQDPSFGSGAEITVFGPDGTVLRNTFDLIDGEGLEIPADGTYRFVVRPYLEGTSFTIWDEASAPDAARYPPDAETYEGCEPTGGGGVTCSGSASGSSSSASGTEEPPVATTATSVVSGARG